MMAILIEQKPPSGNLEVFNKLQILREHKEKTNGKTFKWILYIHPLDHFQRRRKDLCQRLWQKSFPYLDIHRKKTQEVNIKGAGRKISPFLMPLWMQTRAVLYTIFWNIIVRKPSSRACITIKPVVKPALLL